MTEQDLQFIPHWQNAEHSELWFQRLVQLLQWQHESLMMYGKQVQVPRLVAYYGDENARYRYSGVWHQPMNWTPLLLSIKQMLEQSFDTRINSVLCNLYRNGHDAMGWHSDNEAELGSEPSIFSLSLGATRFFDYRRKSDHSIKHRIQLNSGSLLIMRGQFQALWQHQVPRQKRITDPRINLTFRYVHP